MVLDAFPEPWVGRLDAATCKGVMLGLNPGRADLAFQGHDGLFAQEIRQRGSYSEWAASWPYLRDPWVATKGPNRFPRSRLRFLRDWTGEAGLAAEAMVTVEMYPWHSTAITGAMRPERAVDAIRRWVLDPVRALGAPVFAFGSPWLRILPTLGFREVDRLGQRGRPYGSKVSSRAVHVYELDGLRIVAEKHLGAAGPPSSTETTLLRAALT